MKQRKIYRLGEIKEKLEKNELPFSGITELGSAEFHFNKPAFYAGVALHSRNKIRPEIIKKLAVSKKERFCDEDPYTELFIKKFPIQIIARDSRFEYDLNRDRENCIYKEYKRKWHLQVWDKTLSKKEKEISCLKFDEFFELTDMVCEYLLRQNKFVVLFDMHSFCFQRSEQTEWFNNPKPEINIGTKASNRTLFLPLIQKFQKSLSKTQIDNKKIRVEENKIFNGGYLSRRIGQKYYNNVLTFALEYKKLFMNEITGQLYPEILELLISDFNSAVNYLFAGNTFTTYFKIFE
ncbi:MAG: N-formylglutamate amidohydrolase [Bacteroidota bacterium]